MNCPDNGGQQAVISDTGMLPVALTPDVAGAVAKVLAEGVGEVRHRCEAAPGSDFGHRLGPFDGCGAGQYRVGEL